MFLVYQQVKKYRAEKSRRAAQANGQESPSVAMPKSQYSQNEHSYPPSDTTAQDQLGPRPPSPTQSEQDFLDGVKERSLAQIIKTYLIIAVIIVVIALVEHYHTQILHALSPATDWCRRTPGAWLVPIAALILLSFPPLFGHEIVAMLCGVAWGLGTGFGIVAAGTIIGEICTFYFFKFGCSGRGRKAEATNMNYATLARVVREGGLLIPIIMRYSALPAHFTTAVFATCGMKFWIFLVAAVVSLPKQLVVVYIGVALNSNNSKSQKIQNIVLAITIVITVLAMGYIRILREKAKPAVVWDRRMARQTKLEEI
ncbi:hypothetical protein B0H11DRAFT_1325299 [Mycena galericulata]|nr:hypothetical protein B0H11DRAFT_1325299 [Mycena galericulata]